MQILKGHQDRVWQVAWHPNGQLLASCGGDKTIHLWMSNDGKYSLSQILDQAHTKTIRCIAFSPDGKYLAAGSFDSIVSIWLLTDGKYKLIQKLEGHESEVKSVGWSYDSRYLASCSRDKTVWIWDHDDIDFQCNCILQAHTQDVKYVKWSPNSYTLYSASYDNNIFQYELLDEEWEHLEDKQISHHTSTVWCIDLNKQMMCSVGSDECIKLYQNMGDGYKLTQSLVGYHNQAIYSCSFNHDGQLLAVGSGDNKVTVFVLDGIDELGYNKYKLLQSSVFHDYDVNCVVFHPSMNLLASCGDDDSVKLHVIEM